MKFAKMIVIKIWKVELENVVSAIVVFGIKDLLKSASHTIKRWNMLKIKVTLFLCIWHTINK